MKTFLRRAAAFMLSGALLFTSLPFNIANAQEVKVPELKTDYRESVNPELAKLDPNLASYKAEEKVRVIVELSEEPIIDKATESGISVPELSQGAFRAQEKAISDEQSTAKSDLANKGVELVEKDKFSVAINGFSA